MSTWHGINNVFYLATSYKHMHTVRYDEEFKFLTRANNANKMFSYKDMTECRLSSQPCGLIDYVASQL